MSKNISSDLGLGEVFEVDKEELIYEEIGFDRLGRATVNGKLLVFRDYDNDRCLLIKTPSKGFKAMKLLSDNFTRMERSEAAENRSNNDEFFAWLRKSTTPLNKAGVNVKK